MFLATRLTTRILNLFCVQFSYRDSDSFLRAAFLQESMPFSLTEKEDEKLHDNADDGRSPMEEDENVSQENDDQEIRMDLTDDLLHTVYNSSSLFFVLFLLVL